MTEPCPAVWGGDGLWQLHGLVLCLQVAPDYCGEGLRQWSRLDCCFLEPPWPPHHLDDPSWSPGGKGSFPVGVEAGPVPSAPPLSLQGRLPAWRSSCARVSGPSPDRRLPPPHNRPCTSRHLPGSSRAAPSCWRLILVSPPPPTARIRCSLTFRSIRNQTTSPTPPTMATAPLP